MDRTMKIMSRSSVSSSDLQKNDQKTLKRQRKILEEEFRKYLDLITYALIIIAFLYDSSIILLILRCVQQLLLGGVPREARDSLFEPLKKVLSQKMMTGLVVNTFVSVTMHLLFTSNTITDERDQYNYTSIFINFVGERKFSNNFTQFISLFFLDLLILLLQFTAYSFTFYYKLDFANAENTEAEANTTIASPSIAHIQQNHHSNNALTPVQSAGETIKEYDGLTGDIMLFDIDFSQVYKTVNSYGRDQAISAYLQQRRDQQREGRPSGLSAGDLV